MYLLDTDHASLYQRGHESLEQRLAELPPNELATTVVTYEEQIQGRLAVIRRADTDTKRVEAYFWLQRTLDFFCRVPVVPVDQPAARKFQRLKALKLRIGTQDLLIASIALSRQAILLTRNKGDFGRVLGLTVEDWTLFL